MQHLRLCLVIWFCVGLGALAQAQNQPALPSAPQVPVELITLGHSIVPLHGSWKFHIGDNPAWADPSFDDSRWETVDLAPKAGTFDPVQGLTEYVPGWTDKGHPGYWGYAWYRMRVRVAAPVGERLAVAGPTDMDDAYQLFVNGVLLGSFGKFSRAGPGESGPPVVYTNRPKMFLLPQSTAGGVDGSRSGMAPADQVLAFRVWMEPTTLRYPGAGGFHSSPRIGSVRAVETHVQAGWLALTRSYAAWPAQAGLFFLLAIVAASLVLFDRSDQVYLWLAAVFLLTAVYSGDLALAEWTQVESATTMYVVLAILFPLTLGVWVLVWWTWFRLRRPAWMPKVIAGVALLLAGSDVLGGRLIFAALPHPVYLAVDIVSGVGRFLLMLAWVWIVVRGIRKQGREGWLTLPAVMLVGLALFSNDLHIRQFWFFFGISVSLANFAYAALAITIFALLLRRLRLSIRHQREMALDVKQAAEVQHVLIPQKLPQAPGLNIESEYRPAREVGGDFFQIIPDARDGSVLIVVGDVTGKGLQAGMLVALIVGAVRSTAQFNPDPLVVLQALNQHLCGRGHAHATCLALKIDADGAATLANAGHLPPYLNGDELPMEGALPLGMVENADFPLLHFQLSENDSLILMSDGISEAQDKDGQLFGFERVHKLLQRPVTAADVATTAQRFGQQDDISVLRILRVAKGATMSAAESAFATG